MSIPRPFLLVDSSLPSRKIDGLTEDDHEDPTAHNAWNIGVDDEHSDADPSGVNDVEGEMAEGPGLR